jgi:hypothetical protein
MPTTGAIGFDKRLVLLGILLGICLLLTFCSRAAGQSAMSSTETKVWPEVDVHIQLPANWRVLAFTGVAQGVGYPYQQWYEAAALGYQFKPILKPHIENIDPDKEHYLVFGGGYEFLRTIQTGEIHHENRITIDGTPGFRLPGQMLVRDRNWIELRWMDGAYSTTYRNMLMVERDFLLSDGLRFSPYASAEVFYNGSKHAWNEQWYSAGIEWPYKRLLMVDTYYRRESCHGCTPTNWNVGGVTLNFYFGSAGKPKHVPPPTN